MTRDNGISRRTAIKLTGAAAATAVVAGCSDDNGDDEENGENGEDGGDGVNIDAGERIVLYADAGGWEGEEPEDISGEDNPTLILEEGEEYEIGWEEGDGQGHNIELVDEDDDVVEDYETDQGEEGGDDQFIEFEATGDIVEYVCRPHQSAMRGEIEVEEGEGNGADDENGDDEENGADDENGDDEENGADDENGEDENGADDENGEDENGADDENGEDDDNLVGDDDEDE